MNVDFYNLFDKKREDILFSINESFFEKNYSILKNNGIFIDIYGTTILTKKDIQLLLQIISKKDNLKLYSFLEKSKNENLSLVIEGN